MSSDKARLKDPGCKAMIAEKHLAAWEGYGSRYLERLPGAIIRSCSERALQFNDECRIEFSESNCTVVFLRDPNKGFDLWALEDAFPAIKPAELIPLRVRLLLCGRWGFTSRGWLIHWLTQTVAVDGMTFSRTWDDVQLRDLVAPVKGDFVADSPPLYLIDELP